jgi:hypothetical protein
MIGERKVTGEAPSTKHQLPNKSETHEPAMFETKCHSELARNLWNPSDQKLEIPRKLGMTMEDVFQTKSF